MACASPTAKNKKLQKGREKIIDGQVTSANTFVSFRRDLSKAWDLCRRLSRTADSNFSLKSDLSVGFGVVCPRNCLEMRGPILFSP